MASPQKREAEESPTGQQPEEHEWETFLNLDDREQTNGDDIDLEEEQHQSTQSTTEPAPASPTPSRPAKKPRRSKNSPEPDYSAIVQGQMAGTNRTGQACDRCKARKMKCDSNPTGCANCSANNSACTQTDPITRESYTRGELERLRADNQRLRQENHELRRQLEQLRPPMMGATLQRSAPPYGTTGPTGYSSLHGLPQLVRQNTTAFPSRQGIYANPQRPSLAGRGQNQGPFGNLATQNQAPTQGFSVPSGQDPFASNQSLNFRNRSPFTPTASTMRRTVSQGYNAVDASARNHRFPFQTLPQTPGTPTMRSQGGTHMALPNQPTPMPPQNRSQPQVRGQHNPTSEEQEDFSSPKSFWDNTERQR
ncbi:hypothetical protein PRK78_004398 [Emydomyces testavorans]|uniref:Zn(2)-C6 fungal-type domain-containing protein n=1 Tax=Emydomyces testavorans TaxID=2070801 RepID=A0AAF0IIK5_9EURO|nr:hypothetical protein PRK78_004398 [Emydomyces testavorans]